MDSLVLDLAAVYKTAPEPETREGIRISFELLRRHLLRTVGVAAAARAERIWNENKA